VAQHRPTGSETTPPYAPRSSRFGSEPPSVNDDVDVWRYAILSCMPEMTTILRNNINALWGNRFQNLHAIFSQLSQILCLSGVNRFCNESSVFTHSWSASQTDGRKKQSQ